MTKITMAIAFATVAFGAASSQAGKAVYGPVERIVVIGDVHGDYDQFESALKMSGLVDGDLRWSGGETHLVQLGDLPDRGPGTRKIISLIRRLEKEALRAKGRVHVLIGNHDAMNIYGDLRYVFQEEFEAFQTARSKRLLDELFKAEVAWVKKTTEKENWPEFNDAYKQEWLKDKPLGYVEHRQHWAPRGSIGKWILSKNAVLKIGDNLFAHAGISPSYSEWKISEINTAVQRDIRNYETAGAESIARKEDGPLWYRGMAMAGEAAERENVERVLRNFGATRIIIGHTPTPGIVVPRFDGRVILADVGLSRYYGDHLACAEITKEGTYAIHRGERLPLPGSSKSSIIAYLDAIERLEPGNKDALRWIERLRSDLNANAPSQP